MKIHNSRYSPVLKKGLAIVRLMKGIDRWPVLKLPKASSQLNNLRSLLREGPASRLLRITRPILASLRDRPNLLNEGAAKRLLLLLGSDFYRVLLGVGQAARSH